MRFSYNKLWELMIERGISKKTIREMSGCCPTSIANLGNGGKVNKEVLLRICMVLKFDFGDIMEVEPDGAKCEKDSDTNMLLGGLLDGN